LITPCCTFSLAVIGRETRQQCLEKWGGKPDIVMACVGGGSNAIGIFNEFVEDREVSVWLGAELWRGGEGEGNMDWGHITSVDTTR
jgi:tryptophan synthase beta subunit